MKDEVIRVGSGSSLGVTVAITTTTYTLPLLGDGTGARALRVIPEAACYLNFGVGPGTTCSVTTGVYVTPNEASYFNPRGYSYVAVIAKTTPTVISFTPVEI